MMIRGLVESSEIFRVMESIRIGICIAFNHHSSARRPGLGNTERNIFWQPRNTNHTRKTRRLRQRPSSFLGGGRCWDRSTERSQASVPKRMLKGNTTYLAVIELLFEVVLIDWVNV
jgi:hypothetical protein